MQLKQILHDTSGASARGVIAEATRRLIRAFRMKLMDDMGADDIPVKPWDKLCPMDESWD